MSIRFLELYTIEYEINFRGFNKEIRYFHCLADTIKEAKKMFDKHITTINSLNYYNINFRSIK